MKKLFTLSIAVLLSLSSFARVELYLGARFGAGLMSTRNQLNQFTSGQSSLNYVRKADTWNLNAKAEALLGFWRMRIGYRFMYNFQPATTGTLSANSSLNPSQITTYFNSAQCNYFAQYGVVEFVVIKLPHFALTPGLALGSFTGFNEDNTTHDLVPLSNTTHHRFTMGIELNCEISFGRWVILVGPNYYLFSLQDKVNTDWHQYQNCVGADIGFRFNLIKPRASK